MAGSKSNWLSVKLLNAVLGQNSQIPGFPAAIATVHVGLWVNAGTLTDISTGSTLGEPGSTGSLPGASYARRAVTNDSTQWPPATGTTVAAKTNGAPITFASAGVGGWGTVNQFAITTSATGGEILYWSDLTTPKAIAHNDTASFAIGALSITED